MNIAAQHKIFSLIISTRNRSQELRNLFSSLVLAGNIEYLYEVIVIDQSDDFNTSSIEKVISEFPLLKIKYFRDKLIGLSNGRNLGISKADLPGVVCFPDDYFWYPENFFKELMQLMDSKQSSIIQTYYREPLMENPRRPMPGFITSKNAHRLRPCSVGIFIDVRKVSKTKIFFDPNIGAGTKMSGGEESDLLFRLLKSGLKVYQSDTPYVYHKIYRGRVNPSRNLFTARAYVHLKNWRIFPILLKFTGGLLKSGLLFPLSPYWRMSLLGRIDAIIYFLCKQSDHLDVKNNNLDGNR